MVGYLKAAKSIYCWFRVSLLSLCLVYGRQALAQTDWATPELSQMYKHGLEYEQLHNYKEAAVVFRQLLAIVPGNPMAVTELGKSYYNDGQYTSAIDILRTYADDKKATEDMWSFLGLSYAGTKHFKEARLALQSGLGSCPASGLLFYDQGVVASTEKDPELALQNWLRGIQKAPGYAPNYQAASFALNGSHALLWSIILGETYLSMAHDTATDDSLKQSLYATWNAFFHQLPDGETDIARTDFEKQVIVGYTRLTPVVSDGISTENLTMAHVRFSLDWHTKQHAGYSFPLLDWQEMLITEGWFDMYTEWLYGSAESKVQSDAWNQFHVGDRAKFLTWKAAHPFIPANTLQYLNWNDEWIKKVLHQKKKR